MLERTSRRVQIRALMVDDEIGEASAAGRAAQALIEELGSREIGVVEATSAEDGYAVISSDSAIHAILLDWDLDGDKDHAGAIELLRLVRSRNAKIPIFLTAERDAAASIPIDVMEMVDEFIWMLQDTAAFIGGRVEAAIRRYGQAVIPPMARGLINFTREYEYSWHTPGHAGGTAFLKSPVGRVFYEFYGENLLRTDLSISVGQLGSLLDHTGPIGAHERYAARVFGSHRTYCVTNGTSTSNRVIFHAAVGRGQIALCDRNCHKSIEHGLVMTGAVPNYLVPLRNRYGLIGPIHPDKLTKAALAAQIKKNPLVTKQTDLRPVHAVITNSTYDGLCYNAKRVVELLDPTVDRIHFDEAWYAYARFNPIYRDRHAMSGDPADHDPKGPTLFAGHSTHKLLAALSQASLLHMRDGRGAIPHDRFNEAFMMHASTSPLYTIIASNDICAAMMDGPGGVALTTESIEEAVAFRQTMGRVNRQFAKDGEWFFNTWNADQVKDQKSGKKIPFHEAAPSQLATDPECWVLHPGDNWHGFADLEDGYCMLDPIKVSVVTPGVSSKGGLDSKGIPATLVTKYLSSRGVEVEKTTDFTVLFLFSIGITKGKWGTLLNILLEFKRDYDRNAPISEVLPALANDYPDTYSTLGLRDVSDQMFAHLKKSKQTEWLAKAFSTLPDVEMIPSDAYDLLVRGQIEHVPLEKAANRVVATAVAPYPPGIPMLMAGEYTGANDGPYLNYLRALQSWDATFPGFGHDTHGAENRDGTLWLQCLKGARKK